MIVTCLFIAAASSAAIAIGSVALLVLQLWTDQ